MVTVRQHDLADDCWCNPTVMPVERDDGSIGWNYAHHEHDQTPAQQAERAAMIAEAMDEQRRDVS